TELNAAYYQGLSKTFSFSASDPTAADGSSGSGLSKYYYKFTQDTATQTVSSSGWTEKVASSSFDVIPSLVSGNTLGTNGELNEGQWYLWYYVKDNAGNASTPASASFWLDQGAPTLNAVITPAENSIVGSGTEFYFNSGLSGTISASDSSNVAPALSYKINNGTAVSVTGTSWSIPASSFSDEGAYSLVFTATDHVGRTATKEFTVHKDISAPTLSITSPAANSYFEQAAINIRGNVSDGTTENPGSGVNKIYYSTDNSTWTELTAYSAGGAIWNDTVSLDQQGNVTLYVKAVDKLGQESDHESVTFSYDAAAPVIVETVSVAANQKQGYSFTLEGTAYDTNELSYVEIVDKIGDTVQGTYKVDNDDDTTDTISIIGENTIANAKSEDTAITWRKTFSASDTTPLAQGQHTFYISAKDTSQRLAATITKDVFIDTVKPVLTITTPDAYTNSEYVTFNGTITEANLSTLVVKLYKQGDATEKATANLTPQGNGTEKTWSYTAHLADNNASYYITVLATDRVDNTEEASTQSHLIKTDRTAPATTLGASGVTNSNAGTVNAISENVTYYAKADYTISGTITETNYDKDKVTITAKKNDVAVTDEELTTLQDSLADSLTSETDKEWSFTGITGTGSYEYKLQIEDLAGNKSIYTILIVYDDTPPTVTHNTVSSIVNTTAYEFSGTITDTNYYNATVVLYKDEDATDATSTIEVDADNNWAWRPTGLEDGIYYAVITAKDKAGNTNTAANGTTGSVIVDRTRPTTSLNGSNLTDSSFNTATTLENEGTYYASSEYTISGTISDVNWGIGATAKYKLDGGTETDLTVNSTTKAWSLPSATAGHTYEIKLKDSAANENTYTVTVSYDATAPNATIVIPEADITNPQYALSSDNYSFKLNAVDNNGGVGVKELSYIFTTTDSLPAVNAGWQTDSNFTTADKFVVMNLVPLNTVDSNSQPVENTLTATQIPEGTWYLWVKAKDKAGNVTPDATITANRRKIIVDKSNPTLTVTNSLNETGTNPIYGDVTDSGYTVSGTISDTNALAVTDESEDENDRVYAIEIKVEGVTATTIASSALEGTDGTVWSYTIPKASIHENGLTEIEIIAKDIVGKTTSKKYTVYYDINDPELEVTAPVNDEQIGNGSDGKANKIIKGTIRDEGYGLAKLEFKLKNSSGSIVKDSSNKDISGYWSNIASDETNNYPIKIKGEQWFYAGQPDENGLTGNTALTIPLGTNEGTLYLEVTATEIGASNLPETSPVTRPESFERNGITIQTVTFFYDASEPNITESGSVSRITNTDFVLIGTAYDTNQLSKIEIKQGGVLKATTADGSITFKASSAEDAAAVTLASATSDSAKGTWKATFDADDYEDGSYQFNITATDISGKMTTVTRTIQMDKTAPANISPSVTTSGTELNSKNWYNSRAIAISVTASDTNGSGVSSADYTLDGPSAQDRSWTNIPNNGEAFVGTVNLPADGENTFYVRVKDVAGNYGYNDTGVKVYIDSAAPASATVASVDGVAAGDGENQFGGTKLTNGSSNIAFTMTAADSGTVGTNATGIDSIKIIKVGNNTLEGNAQINVTETAGVLGATIPKTSVTTSGGVIARVTDKVGNSYDFTLFQIQFDNKYPKVTISNIADADTSVTGTQINGITTISGTASDDQTLASVKLQYSKKTGETTWSDWADTGLTNQGTIYSWSFKVDTTQSPYSDGDTVRFRVLATDAAGNEGNSGSTASAITASNYKEVVISQDTDRPVIKINNLEMTNPVDTNYYWLKYDTMYGTVSDDDGTVESVKYKVHRAVEIETEPTDDQGNSTWETVSQNYYTSFTCEDDEVATGSFAAGTYYTKSAWSSNVYNNGMWEISSLGDGQTWIYFEVKDAEQRTAEKVFTSNANSTTPASYGPKIKDSTGTAKLGYSNTQNDILKVKVDTAAPEIISEKYYLSPSAAYDAGTAWGDKNNIGVLSTTKCGGKDKFLYIRVETRDSNGINTGRTAIKFNNTAATTTADGDTPNPVRIIQQNPSGSTVVTIVRIDLSQFSSGTNNFAIDLYDNAGKSTKDTKSILIDNTAPELMVSNYTAGVMLYGSNNNSFRLYQNGDSDISKFYFYVTDNSDFAPVYNSASNTYTGFTEMDDQKVGTTTTVFFDGGTTSAVEYHAPKFYNIIQALTGKSDDQMLASDDPVPLWFWFYAVDDLGNASVPSAETRFAFNVFPNGDKPRIDITYPARKQADQNAPVSVGGTIRVTGYTEISTDTVDAVYIQIDPTYDYSDSDNLDGDAFNEAGWKAELETAISGKNVSYSIVDLRGENLYGTDIPADSPYRYAIKASGTVNWSFNLNSRQEVNTNDNHVAIRAFAVSSTNHKISEPVTHVVKIDANAPLIGNTKPLELVKYENADGTGNIVARQVYATDMYLKGKWYLEGSIEHESGIKTATWSYSDFEGNTWVAKSENIVDENTITSGKVAINSISSSTSYKNYNFKLPVGFDGDDCGTLNYTLVITDGRSNGAQSVEEK
ncbi:Ig-like domain-containing protein, partial [Pseudobutyrivibrio sp.]|uniref:Ig-like domain-containing protein n=1 Tax=Pseudobutyrivibrio sp. TaxID=2014367 RepID=UPI0025F0394F